ncbi:MAG: HAMP domain-containing sensor histidine kinase [Polyangiales bacterium]
MAEQADALVSVVESVDAGVVVVGRERTVLFANARASALLRVDAGALERTPIAKHLTFIEDVLREGAGVVREQREVTLGDGSNASFAFCVSPATIAAEAVWVVSLQDVTPRRRMQGERDLFLQLAAVGEAMPTVLHELRNPLAAVLSAIEVLADERREDAALRDELQIVENEVRRALLGIEGLGLGSRSLRSQGEEDVGEAIRTVCHVLGARARRNRIELDVQVDSVTKLYLDASAMRALVYNLVTNAIHACKAGAKVRVRAQVERATQDFELTVEDTGSGMTPEVLARCTQLFFTTKRSGSGIGLALCRDLVMRGGADLNIVSAVGVGTKVRITVPVPHVRPLSNGAREERRESQS